MLRAVNDIASEWYVDPEPAGRDSTRLLLEHGTRQDLVSEVYRYNTRERIWIEENTYLVRDQRTGGAAATMRAPFARSRRRFGASTLQERYEKIAGWHLGLPLPAAHGARRTDRHFPMPASG